MLWQKVPKGFEKYFPGGKSSGAKPKQEGPIKSEGPSKSEPVKGIMTFEMRQIVLCAFGV